MRPSVDTNIAQLQGQISMLTKNIQELTLPRVGPPQLWCIDFYTKVHKTMKFRRLGGHRIPSTPDVSSSNRAIEMGHASCH